MNKLNLKKLLPVAGIATAAALPASAFAVGPDFSVLTTAIDLSTVAAGVLSTMAAIAGIVVVFRGGSMIISALRRA
mgnify:CR=1 FL=1